jgi:hypothetical protein
MLKYTGMKIKTKGILFLLLPIFIIFGVLVLYSVFTFVSLILLKTNAYLNIISFILGILGIVGILSLIPGLIFGIKFLLTIDHQEVERLKNLSAYKNLNGEQAVFVSRVSWGAFFNPLVWGLGNKVYLWAVLSLIPFFNIYVWIKLTLYGRQMAWERGRWKDFEQFKKRQKIMAWIILSLKIFSLIFSMFILPILIKYLAAQAINSRKDLISNSNTSVSAAACERLKDSDGDGLFDYNEALYYKTNPNNSDSDSDGYSDFQEVRGGYNPNGSGQAERAFINREDSSFYRNLIEKCEPKE